MKFFQNPKIEKALIISFVLFCLLGFFYRFYHVTENSFYFYDEGYYLNFNLQLVKLIALHPPADFTEFLKEFYALVRASLGTGKAFWFLLVDSRVFWGWQDHWFFPRLISAVAGVLTFFVLFLFTEKYFQSRWAAWMAVALLAALPGHVFYSRLAIQESLCTLLFLTGFYFYVFPRKFGWRTFLSAFFLSCAYFTNYRLMVLPLIVAVCEGCQSFSLKEWPDYRKYIWHFLTFVSLGLLIGCADRGQNLYMIYSWGFHQGGMAKEAFDPINFLSYPYYLFRLEGILFALCFFANGYWLLKRQWHKTLPFVIMGCLMAGFSLAGEKGARYMAVGLPLAVAAVAGLIYDLYNAQTINSKRMAVCLLFVLIIAEFLPKTLSIVQTKTDYRESYDYIRGLDSAAGILSSQNYVQNLYAQNPRQVLNLPYGFDKLKELYAKGYRYMVIDPQAYVSYTQDDRRFETKLKDYLGFIRENIAPIKSFEHFDGVTLDRFTMEHNENLRRSIKFLSRGDEFRQLYVYDLKECITIILNRLSVLDKT